MKRLHLTDRKHVGWLLRPFAVLAIGVLMSVSPLPAFASSSSTGGGPSTTPATRMANHAAIGDRVHPDHHAVLDLYRHEAKTMLATVESDIDRQKTSTLEALDEIQATATRVVQQSPQETGARNSAALWRLKEEARFLKARLTRQARALRDQWDAAAKRALTQSCDALAKVEARHAEPDSQRAKHRTAVRQLLRQQRKEMRSLLGGMRQRSDREAHAQIAQAIKSLNKTIALEQRKERGPIVGYTMFHHRGHFHRDPVYQNDPHRL